MFLTALGAFIGAALSLLLSIFIENQRKPNLYFKIEDPPIDRIYPSSPAKNVRFVRVQLWNRAMPDWLRWLGRNAAQHCNGEIQFHHTKDGSPIFSKPMPLRWAGADEPISHQIVDGSVVQLFDPAKYNAASRRNCYPGSKETIDIAARFDNDDECYGWSNENYLPGRGWRNKDRELPKGKYLVSVLILSAGEKVLGVFALENTVSREHFRLMDVSTEEYKMIESKFI